MLVPVEKEVWFTIRGGGGGGGDEALLIIPVTELIELKMGHSYSH